MIRLKFMSNGMFSGSMVVDAETGAVVDGVTSCDWHIDSESGVSKAVLHVDMMEAEFTHSELGSVNGDVAP